MFHRLDQTLVNKLFENQSVFIPVLPINTHCGLFPLLTPLHFSVGLSLSRVVKCSSYKTKQTGKRQMQYIWKAHLKFMRDLNLNV